MALTVRRQHVHFRDRDDVPKALAGATSGKAAAAGTKGEAEIGRTTSDQNQRATGSDDARRYMGRVAVREAADGERP